MTRLKLSAERIAQIEANLAKPANQLLEEIVSNLPMKLVKTRNPGVIQPKLTTDEKELSTLEFYKGKLSADSILDRHYEMIESGNFRGKLPLSNEVKPAFSGKVSEGVRAASLLIGACLQSGDNVCEQWAIDVTTVPAQVPETVDA